MSNNSYKIILSIIILTVLVFAFSPSQWTPALVVNNDKLSHMVVFFMVSILLSLVYPQLKLWQHSFLLLSFAIFIELVQYLIVSRGFSVEDILSDVIGIFMFYILVFWAKNKDIFMKKILSYNES